MKNCGNDAINKTFIIEPILIENDVLSACTSLYTNLIESCSGDTSIQLGTGLILFSGSSQFSSITASTIEATTYLSGGTNILDIVNLSDTFVTGGTFNNFTDSIQLTRNDGVNIVITGLTDLYTTGVTLYNNILYFDRNDTLSAYTVDLSTLVVTDTYLTGATYDKNSGILELTRNDNFNIFVSGITDYYVTAGTYNTLTESIDFSGNNQVTTFSVDVSALIDDTNTYITGFTYDNSNNLTIVRNDGTAFTTNISVVSGLTINGDLLVTGFTNLQSVSATTISADTFYGDGSNLTGIDNFYTTASTLINNVLYFDRNDTLSAYTVDLSSLVDDTNFYVTGGTINYGLGEILLNRNDNVTVTITGLTDFYTTGATLIGSELYFDRNDTLSAYTVDLSTFTTDNFYTTGVTLYGAVAYFDRNDTLSAYTLDYSSLFNTKLDKSGGTITGSISAVTISADTFYGDGSNLTGIDNFYTTGVTIINNVAYFDRTDILSAYTLTLSGFSTNDIYVTGGTVNGTELTLTRNDNVSVLITGFSSDIYTTGSTLIGNIAYFNTTNSLSAYTLDLTSLAPSGGTDNYTTGATLIGDIVYFDRTDVLSAYTLDLSTISPTGSTSGGTDTIRFGGVRNRANNNDIFLRYYDGVPYNILPYRVYQDSVITNVVAAGSSLDTWDAHILTGTTIATDSIYFLSLINQDVKYDNSVNLTVTSGTTLYLYMSGTSVDYPSINVYIRKL